MPHLLPAWQCTEHWGFKGELFLSSEQRACVGNGQVRTNGKIETLWGRILYVPGPRALTSPRDLLEMKNLKPHPRHWATESTYYQDPEEIHFTHRQACGTLL